MKVVLVNGSRRENGCTNTALGEIAKVLNKYDIETELFFIGKKVMNGEINTAVAEVAEAIKTADGFIVGSPVYYASPSGEVISFLDRLFGAAEADLRFKPAAAITSARRGGTTATLDVLNKYFLYNQMPLISSRYWNMVHGNTPEEVLNDEEGIQIMQTIGRNMAWILKSIEAGKNAGVEQPVAEQKKFTNFIR
ncbi:MAG: flavodoxin family protein [Oscillospiraceae bacterium]|nr:flavodoxin family protein [Oscillospiraceae bacterium]